MQEIKCRCGNAARYVSQRGDLTCSLCPLVANEDSIPLRLVPGLMHVVRRLVFEHDQGYDFEMQEYIDSFKGLLGKDVSREVA